jgi:hypothetical protein
LSQHPSLLSIIAHARSGAVDHAWRLFREAGFENVDDDPAVLSVRGRLLKDRALGASGAERRQFYLAAALAYTRAAEIGGANYPLINAATLSLLAGQREESRNLAGQLLARASLGADEPETPYYRAATEAEAWLLLGEIARAQAAFDEAIALAPLAFEDHASTLRQFALILDESGSDKAWLDARRPPRCLHFAGHIALAAGDGAIEGEIRALIKAERVGFGFGALAAGADILIAEALLDVGAELHLVLPAARDVFREYSVARFGGDWSARFDAIVESAASVREFGRGGAPMSQPALQWAAEIAMGKAAMQAEVLMTEAIQLLVADGSESVAPRAGGSAWIGAAWERSGRRQRVIVAKRSGPTDTRQAPTPETSDRLAAMLRIDLADADGASLAGDILPKLAAIFAGRLCVPPRWTGEAVSVAFETVSEGAYAALAASAVLSGGTPFRIAGHYSIATRVEDPFGGKPFLMGPPLALLDRIARSTPSGAIHVTEDFAAALYAGSTLARPRTEYIGEFPLRDEAVRLFSLKF